MIAGRMAIAFLKKAIGITPNLPGHRGRLTLDALSELVAKDAGYTDPANVESRIWRPSLPIVHVAAALLVLHQDAPVIPWRDLMAERPLLEAVVRTAADYADLLARSHFRGINPDRLIKIRLAN